MKKSAPIRMSLAAALAAFAGAAWSQAPAPAAVEVPKPTCGDLPTEVPTRSMPDSRKRAFERQMRDYGTCIKAYVEERNAVIRAQQKTVQGYVDAYNQVLQKYQAEREDPNK